MVPRLSTLAVTEREQPRALCGRFAAVFEVHNPSGDQKWALKCFTRRVRDLQQRYHQIATHLDEQQQRQSRRPARQPREDLVAEGPRLAQRRLLGHLHREFVLTGGRG